MCSQCVLPRQPRFITIGLGLKFRSPGILAADSLSGREVHRPGDNYLHRVYRGEEGTTPVVAMSTDVVQKATEGKTSYQGILLIV